MIIFFLKDKISCYKKLLYITTVTFDRVLEQEKAMGIVYVTKAILVIYVNCVRPLSTSRTKMRRRFFALRVISHVKTRALKLVPKVAWRVTMDGLWMLNLEDVTMLTNVLLIKAFVLRTLSA